MDPNELLALYDREERINFRIPGNIFENTGRVVRDYSLDEASGFIDHAALDETCADAEIDAQVAFFESLGLPFTWKVFDHDRPPDLRQRLAARGFTTGKPEALMILDFQTTPDFYGSAALPECVKNVIDPAEVEAVVRLEEEVWQSPHGWLKKWLLQTLQTSPDRLSLYAVPLDGRTVSAAWTYYNPSSPFARLLGGSTLPAYRRCGFYTALLAVRAREARQRGCRFLAADASPMSRPVLEKAGFQCLGFSTRCRRQPES